MSYTSKTHVLSLEKSASGSKLETISINFHGLVTHKLNLLVIGTNEFQKLYLPTELQIL